MEGDGRLARAGTALDQDDAGQGRPDDLVLLPLDGGDDVGHPAGARPLQGGQQGALADQDEVVPVGSAVRQLVVEAGEPAAPQDEVAPADQAHRRAGGRPVERLGGRRPPVDDQRLVVLVGDRHPADVVALAAVASVRPNTSPASPTCSDASRRSVTCTLTSRSSRAWWVPPGVVSMTSADTARAASRMASMRA